MCEHLRVTDVPPKSMWLTGCFHPSGRGGSDSKAVLWGLFTSDAWDHRLRGAAGSPPGDLGYPCQAQADTFVSQ